LFVALQEEPQSKTVPVGEDKKAPSAPRQIDLGPVPASRSGRIYHAIVAQMLKHHAHPIAVHFPNGLLPVSFIFMMLALWFESEPLGIAAFCNLVFVAAAMPLVLFSGYVEWKNRYKGARTHRFMTKITCAGLVAVCVLSAVIWWSVQPNVLQDISGGRSIFILINLLGLIAAAIAGLIGGKLVFKD
jgi:uncharacterized membrane protein